MASLNARVAKLHRLHRARQRCPTCDAKEQVVVVWPGETPPEPQPCPKCRRTGRAKRIEVVYEDKLTGQQMADRPRLWSRPDPDAAAPPESRSGGER